jgi:hypothetical protein
MNFIVGRMVISDMRTSCDQYARLHRDTAKTRAVGKSSARLAVQSADFSGGRLFHRAAVLTARPSQRSADLQRLA